MVVLTNVPEVCTCSEKYFCSDFGTFKFWHSGHLYSHYSLVYESSSGYILRYNMTKERAKEILEGKCGAIFDQTQHTGFVEKNFGLWFADSKFSKCQDYYKKHKTSYFITNSDRHVQDYVMREHGSMAQHEFFLMYCLCLMCRLLLYRLPL